MKAKEIKEYIYKEKKVPIVLEKLSMHNIKYHEPVNARDGYFSCAMPSGDNLGSTTVFNNAYLYSSSYTRDIEDENGVKDLISLITFVKRYETDKNKDFDFIMAMSWLHDVLELPKEDEFNIKPVTVCKPFEAFKDRLKVNENQKNKRDIKLYDDEVLDKYRYCEYYEKDFEKDNIPTSVQNYFGITQYTELKYRYPKHYFLIPVIDEIGNIAGIKLRSAKAWQYGNNKYFYPESCEKSSILYGLFQTRYYIDQKKELIVCEAEKGVMQLWNYGYRNAVAVGGHSISQVQVEKILKLEVDKVIIAFDQDVEESILLTEYEKLSSLVETTCIIDLDHILEEKESPMDNPNKWETLYNNYQTIPLEYRESEETEEIKEWENLQDDFEF